ncbi:hypothetical protein D3C81_1820630 [compost metagenome]
MEHLGDADADRFAVDDSRGVPGQPAIADHGVDGIADLAAEFALGDAPAARFAIIHVHGAMDGCYEAQLADAFLVSHQAHGGFNLLADTGLDQGIIEERLDLAMYPGPVATDGVVCLYGDAPVLSGEGRMLAAAGGAVFLLKLIGGQVDVLVRGVSQLHGLCLIRG